MGSLGEGYTIGETNYFLEGIISNGIGESKSSANMKNQAFLSPLHD